MSDNWPSLQYLDDVDKGGVADMAGLKRGDFLLEINGQDVSQASHETVVNIIRQSGDLVAMTVVSAVAGDAGSQANYRQCATLPSKLSKKGRSVSAPAPPKRDPKTTLTLGPKSGGHGGPPGHAVGHGLGLGPGNGLGPTIDPSQTLAGPDSAVSFAQQQQQLLAQHQALQQQAQARQAGHQQGSTVQQVHYEDDRMCMSTIEDGNKLASIRSRPSSRRMTSAELEEFFTRQSQQNLKHKQQQQPFDEDARRCATIARFPKSGDGTRGAGDIKPASAEEEEALKALHKNFASVPDLNKDNEASKSRSTSGDDLKDGLLHLRQAELVYSKSSKARHKDDRLIYAETFPLGKKPPAGAGPPPTHPPPPPPGQGQQQQMLQVGGAKPTDYAGLSDVNTDGSAAAPGGVMSSFRPGDSAKLYASPESVMSSVGYRPTGQSQSGQASMAYRSQSVPPPKNRAPGGPESNAAAYKMQVNAGMGSGTRGDESVPGDEAETPPLPPPPAENLPHPRHHHQPLTGHHHHPGHPPFIPDPDYNSSDDDTPKQDLPLPPPPPLPGQASGGAAQIKPPVRSSSIQEQPLPKPPHGTAAQQFNASATGVQIKRQGDKLVLEVNES
ncbi:hypothetical protein BIW11_09002 [Tropilaelaps mercedesae]|uniref:PDZ domain-containing protein n=1 Tax=Tropilaelaps mercedesae TaxID=418985 RepID=A0A1V9XLZ1_9ACAR|nr:hypothetical protein BIW11_09002 [Tropilaelaps mercedesae]